MRKYTLFIAILLFINCSSFAQNKDENSIRKMLAAQVTEWNKGSIDGYMKGYWESDSLVFIGSKGPRYGFDMTLKKYKEAYPDADHMGTLTSTISSMKKLAPDYYFIIGSWGLQRKAGDVGGSYTLLLRKIKDNWVIVCDHSS
jgi:ketosteroid isomerase-like protein